MAEHFIQKEVDREERAGTKGSFRAAAKRHGMSTKAYAEKEKHAGGKVGKRARFALVLMGAHH